MGAIGSTIIGLALLGSWDAPLRDAMHQLQKVTSVSQRPVEVAEQDAAPASPTATTTIPELPAPAATEVDESKVDIYAPNGNKATHSRLQRTAGDNDVLLIPSARPLQTGQVNVSLDEFILWRVSMGVTDDLTLEANSLWGFSVGVDGKYALVRKHNSALSFAAGAAALTVDKHYLASHLSLLYAKDFPAGAIHAAGHMVFVNAPGENSRMIPQLTLGAEAKIARHVTAIGELGFGNDVLDPMDGYDHNTGFANVGFRVYGKKVYATGSLLMPTNRNFLESRALGIPFVRIGGNF